MRALTFACLWLVGLQLQCFGQASPVQNRDRTCATTEYLAQQEQQDPTFMQRKEALEQAVQKALQRPRTGQAIQQTTIIIPVVFHVVYNTESENISDEQILSQLAVLNADFRRLNADAANTPPHFQSLAADTQIEFCLAITDPNGELTSGITRTRSTESVFRVSTDNVKNAARGGVEGWNRDQYLNIWVCNLESGYLGYASLASAAATRDGVVIHYESIGAPPSNNFPAPYNLGRTATHEVGHWLGLKHIWGSGSRCTDSDDIADTPNQLRETTGCPDSIVISCDNGPYGNMWMNYMDYSDDACMNMFTKGQADYMRAFLAVSRPSILSSLACSVSLRSRFSLTNQADSLVMAGSTVGFTDRSEGLKPVTWFWEFEGGIPATSTAQHPTVTYPAPGKYNVTLTVSNGSLSSTKTEENIVHATVTDLVAYPNPASDYLMLEQPVAVHIQEVELVNQVGQTLLTARVQERVTRLDIQHVPAGVYFLRIRSSNGLQVKKISIVR